MSWGCSQLQVARAELELSDQLLLPELNWSCRIPNRQTGSLLVHHTSTHQNIYNATTNTSYSSEFNYNPSTNNAISALTSLYVRGTRFSTVCCLWLEFVDTSRILMFMISQCSSSQQSRWALIFFLFFNLDLHFGSIGLTFSFLLILLIRDAPTSTFGVHRRWQEFKLKLTRVN